MRLAIVIGTRPEVIKAAPLLREPDVDWRLIVEGQSPDLLDGALIEAGCSPTYRPVVRRDGWMGELAGILLHDLTEAIAAEDPTGVLVVGDTMTAWAGAVAAALLRLPVGHVEAGLRTPNPWEPFPEEKLRRMITQVAEWHFAPTRLAVVNLEAAGICRHVYLTGNTVVDQLRWVVSQGMPAVSAIEPGVVLVTMHRRENAYTALERVHGVLERLSRDPAFPPVVWVLHPSKAAFCQDALTNGAASRMRFVDPLSHAQFLSALAGARLVVTDSGGVIEEATTLRVPLVITRASVERHEAIEEGAWLADPASEGQLSWTITEALRTPQRMPPWSTAFGRGDAAPTIVRIIWDILSARRSFN